MSALARMRLRAYLRTGRPVAPLIAVLAVLGVLYGGGRAPVGEAYGVSAVLLFPVLAWQTKLLLDAEPDLQRRLARVTVGSPVREAAAGVAAALTATLPVVLIALGVPWLVSGVAGPAGAGLVSGVWAHLLMVPAAVGLGALASRAVTTTFGRGAAVLVGGAVAVLVAQTRGSSIGWIAPPLISVAHVTANGSPGRTVALLTVDGLVWAGLALAAYGWLRRTRP